jgi:hypothetical protein
MANISEFNGKKFNPQVFDKYTEKVPNLKRNELIKNGVFDVKNKYKALCTNQDGGDFIITPIKGLLDGDVQNYDGVESFVPTSRKTFSQGKPIFGRMKAWQEKDFATELTGVNWMKDAAAEVAEYYQGVDQDDLLAILEGIFKMDTSNAGNAEFVEKHSTEIEGNITSSTANNAAQKACGDNKKIITMAFMHSDIATSLENMQLLTYMLYNDAEGIQRQLNIATWNGKVVIIDDSMPVEQVATTYKKTTDAAVVAGKDYYTKSGSTYTKVESPADANISSYYEVDEEAHDEYTTYLLGKGAFEFENIGVKVPSETQRDAKTNGGIDVLYTRQRHLVSPKYISYTKASQATNSATKAELATGSNWELVHDGAVSGRTYVNHKAIPIVKIVSRG